MNKRLALGVFILALVLRLVYLAVIYEDSSSLLEPDSRMYLAEKGAETALQKQVEFGERIPVYLLFVTGVRALFNGDLLGVIYVQAMFGAFVCVLVAYLSGFLNPRLMMPVGVLTALNANMIVQTSIVLSDSLFMVPFVGGLVAMATYIRMPSYPSALATAILFGLALLVRPVLLYFPIFLIIFMAGIAFHQRVSIIKSLSHAGLVVAIFTLFVSPIFVKNYKDTGHFSYVSQTGSHALNWVYPQAREFAQGTPREKSVSEANARLKNYLESMSPPIDPSNHFAMSAAMKSVAADLLWELGPVALIKAWVAGMFINVNAPALISSPIVQNMERPSFILTQGDTPVEKIWNYLSENPAFTWVMLPALALTGVMRLLLLYGMVHAFARKWRIFGLHYNLQQAIFLIFMSGYIFAVTGPIIGVKYRLSVEPVMDIFIGVAVLAIFDWYQKRKTSRQHT